MCMRVTNLSSGSKGNCSIVVGQHTNVLIDIGIGIRLLESSLQQVGLKTQDIGAILITHEHTDHICGLECFAKKYPDVHVFVYAEVWEAITRKHNALNKLQNIHKFAYDTMFSVGEFSCVAMNNFHDSTSCASFILAQNNSRVGFCTDLGIITDYQVDMLSTCKVVFLESNHDKEMLKNCAYPYILKQRIGGNNGHLSNEQCAVAALKMVQNKTKVIVLSHISENSNLPEKAYSHIADVFEQNHIKNVHILLSYPKKVGKTITIL